MQTHYECRSCSPPRSYPADGKPHAIPGDEEVRSEAVTVLSPRSIRTRIVSPSLVRETTMTASTDDSSAMYVSLDHRPSVNGILRTRYLARRVAPAPAGANRVSGSWQGVAYLEVPKQVRTIILQLAGNRFFLQDTDGRQLLQRRWEADPRPESIWIRWSFAGARRATV